MGKSRSGTNRNSHNKRRCYLFADVITSEWALLTSTVQRHFGRKLSLELRSLLQSLKSSNYTERPRLLQTMMPLSTQVAS